MGKSGYVWCFFVAGCLFLIVGLVFTFEALWTGGSFLPGGHGLSAYYTFRSSPFHYLLALASWIFLLIAGAALMRAAQLAWKRRGG